VPENKHNSTRRKVLKTAAVSVGLGMASSTAVGNQSNTEEAKKKAREALSQRYNASEADIVLDIAEDYEGYDGEDAYEKATSEIIEHPGTPKITEDLNSDLPPASDMMGERKEVESRTLSHCSSNYYDIERTDKQQNTEGAAYTEYKSTYGDHNEFARAGYYGAVSMRCLQQAYIGFPSADGTYQIGTWVRPDVKVTAGGEYELQIVVFDHTDEPTQYIESVNSYVTDHSGYERIDAQFHLEKEHYYSCGVITRSTASAVGDAGAVVDTWYDDRIFSVYGDNIEVKPYSLC
jgi:hypothetical protein